MLTDEEIERAYYFWLRDFRHFETDEAIAPYLRLPRWLGWLELARKALGLSTAQVAASLEVSLSAYTQLERHEKRGRATLQSLQRAAQAMDCELIYAIRPKSKQRFSRIVWEQIYPSKLNHHCLLHCDPQRRANALAHAVHECP